MALSTEETNTALTLTFMDISDIPQRLESPILQPLSFNPPFKTPLLYPDHTTIFTTSYFVTHYKNLRLFFDLLRNIYAQKKCKLYEKIFVGDVELPKHDAYCQEPFQAVLEFLELFPYYVQWCNNPKSLIPKSWKRSCDWSLKLEFLWQHLIRKAITRNKIIKQKQQQKDMIELFKNGAKLKNFVE